MHSGDVLRLPWSGIWRFMLPCQTVVGYTYRVSGLGCKTNLATESCEADLVHNAYGGSMPINILPASLVCSNLISISRVIAAATIISADVYESVALYAFPGALVRSCTTAIMLAQCSHEHKSAILTQVMVRIPRGSNVGLVAMVSNRWLVTSGCGMLM